MSKALSILAHVDAGKTTLSERILYLSKEINTVGEVEEGLATMDYLPTEKEKGITIETGVSSYIWRDEQVDFLDTPGHIDFSAEVDCALYASQGAILVVCGQNSLETQTISAWNKIVQHNVTPLIFVNKLDIEHADLGEVLIHIEEQIERHPIALNLPIYTDGKLVGVFDLISNVSIYSKSGRKIEIDRAIPQGLEHEVQRYRKELIEAVVEYDDGLMEKYLMDGLIGPEDIIQHMPSCFQDDKYIPLCLGSAKQSIGVRQLLNTVNVVFPSFTTAKVGLCSVLKVRTFSSNGLMYIAQAITDIQPKQYEWWDVYGVKSEELISIESIKAGEIFSFKSSDSFSIGDIISELGLKTENIFNHKYNPLVKVQLEGKTSDDITDIDEALKIIDKTDPSLKVESDYEKGCWDLYVVGEVHLDYIKDRLTHEFKCDFSSGEPHVQYYEELIQDIPFFVEENEFEGNKHSIALEMRRLHSKNYSYEIDSGSYPPFIDAVVKSAIEECVAAGVVGKGELRCVHFVIKNITSSGVLIPGQLKRLLIDAIRYKIEKKDIVITEPIMTIEIVVPNDYCGKLISDLQSRRAIVQKIETHGMHTHLKGEIPLNETLGYSIEVRTLTKGTTSFSLNYNRNDRI
ncbi:MAG: GTP-binding protein [Fibrobacterales bacterium]